MAGAGQPDRPDHAGAVGHAGPARDMGLLNTPKPAAGRRPPRGGKQTRERPFVDLRRVGASGKSTRSQTLRLSPRRWPRTRWAPGCARARTGKLIANHIPFVLDRSKGPLGTLVGHVSRANGVWRGLAPGRSVVMFQGPQSYVAPAWYPGKAAHGEVVPTWTGCSAAGPAHGCAAGRADRALARELPGGASLPVAVLG
ncbi:MAG TPA: FMN-binding negative transcriptional regulator [Roseateles sp.]|nr:FMN-binding negative transcriptional regulator [Roseateles sp.]